MSEIESLLANVWNPGTRPFVDEAWRSYNAGAIRASIVATWTAVTADIIAKIGNLADDGDAAAQAFSADVDNAQRQGLKSEGVRAMQQIESALLAQALKFEFIDAIDHRSLERIQRTATYAYIPRCGRSAMPTCRDLKRRGRTLR